MKLTCPIRGELNTNKKAKDDITFTEETRRIELVRFLLSKGYSKDLFSFEKNVWNIGNSGRNHLRADIALSNSCGGGEFLIAEIKRDNKDKEDAITQQLIPACIKTQCQYGIYYDGVENIFFRREDDYKKEYSLLKFPLFNFNFEDKPLTYEQLIPLENINEIIEKIDQLLHNIGTTKESRYKELFKIIQSKYFDEKKNKETNNILKFQTSNNAVNNIKELYEEAKIYYNNLEDLNIALPDHIIEKIVKLLQNYSFTQSQQNILQSLFMKFAQSTLKIELDQFYTPIDIVDFILSMLKVENVTKVIDPAGGSADFLVACLKKNTKSAENIYYWDSDQNAKEVAKLNMILNGDGRTNIKVQDSIQNYKDMNEKFDLVITNPPFGDKTIFEGSKEILNTYNLFNNSEKHYKQLGILFIERSLNLLKDGGILTIIIPNGYMTNPDDISLRKWILENYKIIAYISLPEGTFKTSGTGVKPGVLIIKKEKNNNKNYKIFTDVANYIGFDYSSKKAERIFCRNNNDGSYLLDTNNNKIILSDLPKITKKFKQFVFDLQLDGFERDDTKSDYSFITYKDLMDDDYHILRAETNTNIYKNTCYKIKSNDYLTLKNLKNDDLSNNKTINIKNNIEYFYLDTSNLEKGDYNLDNKIYGWNLPNRAKQSVKKYDICISKLKGSIDKFCMILEDNTENIVLTNGCYRIRIEDELLRLSFYKFLFSKEYTIQMEALATGSIMLDVKKQDIKNNLYFPKLNPDELQKMINFVKQQEFFIKLKKSL